MEIRELESEMRKNESKLKDIESLQERIGKLESVLEASKELDTTLSGRVCRLESILNEQNQSEPAVEGNKINEMEEKLNELGQNFYILMSSVDDLERTSKVLECRLGALCERNQNMKCGICGQNFRNEQTLSEHFRRFHQTFKP